jgi:hypothetical protein
MTAGMSSNASERCTTMSLWDDANGRQRGRKTTSEPAYSRTEVLQFDECRLYTCLEERPFGRT